MDDFTYGDSPACVSLARILTEQGSEKLNRKIGRFLSQYTTRLARIYRADIELTDKRWAISHACDDYIKSLDYITDKKIHDHASNVGKMYYKRYNQYYQTVQEFFDDNPFLGQNDE